MSKRSELREQAMDRANYRCEWPYCPETQHLEMSHIIPLGSGGKDAIENVWMLHRYHHDMHDGREQRRLHEYRLLALAYIELKHGDAG